MTEKLAKAIVRKYGKGKDHLTSQDCSKVLNRRYAKMNPTKEETPLKRVELVRLVAENDLIVKNYLLILPFKYFQ